MQSILFFMSIEINQTKLSERILTILKAVGVLAGLYVFLSLVFVFLLYTLGFLQMSGSTDILLQINTPEILEQFLAQNTTQIIYLNLLISIILHFLLSGIYGMIIKSTQSTLIGLTDALKLLFTKRGLKVFLYITLIQMAVNLINHFFNLYDLTMVGFSIGALLQFLTYFTIPFIYIENSGFFNAISKSVRTINSKPLFFIPLIFFTYLVSLSGILLFGIGIVFTLPFNFIMAYSLFTIIREVQTTRSSES